MLSFVSIYSSVITESRRFEMEFLLGYMICLRTISFFSNWLQLVQSQCNFLICNTAEEMEYLEITLRRLLLLSNLNLPLNPSILDWAEENRSTSFVSRIKRTYKFLLIVLFKESNSCFNELIFKYRIFSNRSRGFYMFFVLFSAVSIRGQLLFEGGFYLP